MGISPICWNKFIQYSLTLIGIYSLKVVGSLLANVDGPAWVELYILGCVEMDGPASSFPCYPRCVEVYGCLPWCLCRRPKCLTLWVGTEEIFSSIDNFSRVRPSTIGGRTCCAVRSFLYWFATAKFNILLISFCCHKKRKKTFISAVLLKKLK